MEADHGQGVKVRIRAVTSMAVVAAVILAVVMEDMKTQGHGHNRAITPLGATGVATLRVAPQQALSLGGVVADGDIHNNADINNVKSMLGSKAA